MNARMVSAEFLKVRKRRGLVISAAILTLAPVVLFLAVEGGGGAASPTEAVARLAAAIGIVGTLGSVVAVLIAANVGAGDVQAGVFRDLVSTGRSRVSLFAARVPAGLLVLWPMLALGWVIACAGSVALAGGEAGPDPSLMLRGGAWVFTAATSIYLFALGIASATGSRSTTVGIVLAWLFIVSQLLQGLPALGVARQALHMAALTRLIPTALREQEAEPVVAAMSVGLAVAVVAAWAAVALAAGAWRTQTRDA